MFGDFNITKKQVLTYSLMPQVLPRFNTLISSGFANLAYFMALVYRATNILPDNHVYLKHSSIGKYTIRNVLTEAANNLTFNFQNIDKIIIFFSLIAGIFILAAQFFLLLIMIFVNPAAAATAPGLPPFGEFFTTPSPKDDIVLNLLNSIFGIPGFFGPTLNAQTDFHTALQGLFQVYSFGLLIVAVIIIIYFIFAILAETAQTGTPFGKRYNQVWAPIRLVVGIGLLVPMAYNLNAGQWITLHAAKMGSGFATTGWTLFNDTLNNTPLDKKYLLATPKAPKVKDLAAFVMISHGCKHAYEIGSTIGGNIKAYIVADNNATATQPLDFLATNYPKALAYSKNNGSSNDIHIRIGVYNNLEYTSHSSRVFNHCGELVIQSTEPVEYNADGSVNTTYSALNSSYIINSRHYTNLQDLLGGRQVATGEDAAGDITFSNVYVQMKDEAIKYVKKRMDGTIHPQPPPTLKEAIMSLMMDTNQGYIRTAKLAAIDQYKPDTKYQTLGWGSAAIWYNDIADRNGSLTTAAINKPQVKRLPQVMREVCDKNRQENKETSYLECHDPNLSSGKKTEMTSKLDERVAKALSDIFTYWYNANDNTGNFFIDVVNLILGTDSLFDMCENADVHPLAQLSSVGKGLIETTIRNLGISMGGSAAGIFAGFLGPAIDSVSGLFGSIASVTILIGFILFYIVPFMPFLYFFFAIGGWLKGLFEAMVGVPLWALAHLRIDGEGLPGDAAMNGYFLIFEIFIRPILIIFGLIASLLIFGAMVKVLNDIFTLVISNVGGSDPQAAGATAVACGSDNRELQQPGTVEWARGPIDELFFTVVYAIIVYMIGMSCFKLIDMIPNNLLRWMGHSVQTFNDQNTTPAEGLLSKVAISGGVLSGQLKGAAGGFKGTIQKATDQALDKPVK